MKSTELKFSYEPVTEQGIQLELRVIAMQYHLRNMDTVSYPIIECDKDVEFFSNHVSSLKYMADFFKVKNRLKENNLVDDSKDYCDVEEDVIQVLIDQCKAMSEKIKPDDVALLWIETCKVGKAMVEESKSLTA